MRWMIGVLAAVVVLIGGAGVLEGQDMVGDVVTDPPAPVSNGGATITGTYQNLGPGSADSANMFYVFGISPTTSTDDGFTAVIDSTVGTDTMGNQAFGFLLDDTMCNHIVLMLGQPDPTGALPMFPIDAGAGGSFTFELPVVAGTGTPTIPMAGIDVGRVVITEPESLRNTYEVNIPQYNPPFHGIWTHAGLYNLVSQGVQCNDVMTDCSDMDACFGRRLWQVEPFEAEVVIALDGSADHFGCDPWTNGAEIAGKIALIRRGGCTFFEKTDNAQVANAAGMIIVNHPSPTGDTCVGEPTADPQECVISMGADPGQGAVIDLPFVMMSQRQGEELFTAIGASQTVRAAVGAVPSDMVDVYPWAVELADPNLDNDLHVVRVPLSYLFTDGFETGDCSMWSMQVP